MKTNFDNLEILSPAGSPETFYAAINAGADAIYLGLSAFNARIKAENFTTDNIRGFVKYAHTFGVKIYITLNTLITDNDIIELIHLVKILVEANVDAFIVQDFGIVNLLTTCFPNIVIHASTQMGIHNLDGAKIAEKLGIKRIVLSRETKLEDIILIHKNTKLEIEYFVQGALCVAFSGNCYLSSVEKGMSGNEGKCLQLCRLPYQNSLTNETAYNLSARDLSLLENLEKLIDAGVTSFKIEGRMRHAGYNSIVTKTYKDALNLIKNNKFSKSWTREKERILRETFSRGDFIKNAYLENLTPDNIINKDYQNHVGIKIGEVISVKPFKNNLYFVKLKTNTPLHSGDGIKIIDEKSKTQIASLGVGNIKILDENIYEIVTKYKFSKNLSVFLTQNSKTENEYLSQKRKIKLELILEAFAEKKLKVLCKTNEICFEYLSEFTLEKAKNSPLRYDDFYKQINKLEDTIFELSYFSVQTDEVFVPKSVLNEVRRNIVNKLQTKLIELNEKNVVRFDEDIYVKLISNYPLSTPKNIAIIDEYFENESKVLEEFDIVVYSPKTYSIDKIKKCYEKFGNKFALNLPTILNFNDKQLIDNILNVLPKNIYLFANNIYALNYNSCYKIILSPLLNIKNKLSILLFNKLGIKTICASIEADDKFVQNNNLIKFCNGKFPLMTFAHCPFKTIFENTCSNCSYKNNFNLTNPNLGTYRVSRTKLFNCYFELTKAFYDKKSKFSIFNFSK